MLQTLQLRNFKAWQESGELSLAPLTLLFGANSAGKSSLGHLLLALKQTVQSAERRQVLQFGDEDSLVDLGSYGECLYRHEFARRMEFALGWTLPQALAVRDAVSGREFPCHSLRLAVALQGNPQAQPHLQQLVYEANPGGAAGLALRYQREPDGSYRLDAEQYRFVRHGTTTLPLGAPDKFHRLSDSTLAQFRNAEFLNDFALATENLLHDLQHLGPLRERPRRLHAWSGEVPDSVGARGEHSIAAILAASGQGRRLSHAGQPELRFDHYLAAWLQRLGIIERCVVQPLAPGRKEVEVLVHTHGNPAAVKLTDTGFGVSQLLPAIVQAFYAAPGSTVWMEQPELHLHPQVQAGLADLFIAAINSHENGEPRGVQIVLESHSEHLLNRLQRRVAEGSLLPEQVAVYFCSRREGQAVAEPLRLNAFGEIENWPEHFFGDEMGDISARTLAALQRRAQAQ